jgi:hypothetical protein
MLLGAVLVTLNMLGNETDLSSWSNKKPNRLKVPVFD